jgi:histidinol-phosphate aminotransferase
MTLAHHGGPDDGPAIRFDFSTNANALGTPLRVRRAMSHACRERYPDPAYGTLCQELARYFGVATQRVLPTAGGAEAIRRLSLAALLGGIQEVWVPQPGYGDYTAAATALRMRPRPYTDTETLLRGLASSTAPALVWGCEPHSPSGSTQPAAFWHALAVLAEQHGHQIAIDRAYEPLRLVGTDPIPAHVAERCWMSWSPNKLLGTPGVRGGVLLAPRDAPESDQVRELAASWVLSAEGVAMLLSWIEPAQAEWQARTRQRLTAMRQSQFAAMDALGFDRPPTPSVTPFWLARLPAPTAIIPNHLQALRQHGIKLRDATSFGLPGWVRVSTQLPEAQQALAAAWHSIVATQAEWVA